MRQAKTKKLKRFVGLGVRLIVPKWNHLSVCLSHSLTFISTHLLSNLPLYDDGDVLAWSFNVYISLNCQNGAHENGTLYFKSSISYQIDQTTLKPWNGVLNHLRLSYTCYFLFCLIEIKWYILCNFARVKKLRWH
jgi:hypothetical protein